MDDIEKLLQTFTLGELKNPFFKYLSHEDKEHIKVVRYLEKNHPDLLWWHTPNEGKRRPFDKYKLSMMGAKKGVFDFAIMKQKFKLSKVGEQEFDELLYSGLFIELKCGEIEVEIKSGEKAGKKRKYKGKASQEQVEMCKKLDLCGYKAEICFGADHAIQIIEEYLRIY